MTVDAHGLITHLVDTASGRDAIPAGQRGNLLLAAHGGLAVVEVGDGVGVEGVDVPGIPHVREVWVYLE
jgi:hypothetical protein